MSEAAFSRPKPDLPLAANFGPGAYVKRMFQMGSEADSEI
jgi:hypothetical protein